MLFWFMNNCAINSFDYFYYYYMASIISRILQQFHCHFPHIKSHQLSINRIVVGEVVPFCCNVNNEFWFARSWKKCKSSWRPKRQKPPSCRIESTISITSCRRSDTGPTRWRTTWPRLWRRTNSFSCSSSSSRPVSSSRRKRPATKSSPFHKRKSVSIMSNQP